MRERATSLTADDAARMREIDYELSRLEEIRALKKEFQPEDIQIVLTHTPLTEEYVANMISWTGKEDYFSMRYAGLILAGHYNGGQWRIPFQGAIYVPELGWFPKDEQIMGLSYLQGIPQHISPGLGSDPHYEKQPGRLFNPPVITKIVLTRKAT
jgi:predicted MPP superfamily phosphohydrolase